MKKRALIALTAVAVSCALTGCVGTPVVYNCTCDPDCCTEVAAEEPAAAVSEEAKAEILSEVKVMVEGMMQDYAPKATEEAEVETTEAAALKTGFAMSVNVADSTPADAENAGAAKYDVTLAAVTVDEAGVIESCLIDSIPATVNFDAEGNVTSDIEAEILTKNELGEDYGMKAYAGSAYEWNEQAAAFAAYATGKTVEEVKGIAVDEKTAQTEADLASTVTIAVGGFQSVIEKAAK